MKMNMDALKALELKLAEYSKENGAIAKHESANANYCYDCNNSCSGGCVGECWRSCSGSCKDSKN